jgi:hypothetical protein
MILISWPFNRAMTLGRQCSLNKLNFSARLILVVMLHAPGESFWSRVAGLNHNRGLTSPKDFQISLIPVQAHLATTATQAVTVSTNWDESIAGSESWTQRQIAGNRKTMLRQA